MTDGFTGNVALKSVEGTLRIVFDILAAVIGTSPETRAAGDVLAPELLVYAQRLDPEETGGAMLLGVDGVCVISHGSSSARAILNAVRVAHELATGDLVGSLRDAVAVPASRDLTRVAGAAGHNMVRKHDEGAQVAETTGAIMSRDEVLELVRSQLAEILEIDISEISESSSFADDLNADSLALIELVEALEEELSERVAGFRIDDEDLEDLRTVRDAVDYVSAKVEAA